MRKSIKCSPEVMERSVLIFDAKGQYAFCEFVGGDLLVSEGE